MVPGEEKSSKLRTIKALLSAIESPQPPSWLPRKSKQNSSQKKGISFQKRVGRYLREKTKAKVFSEQWIVFEDAGGVGYAQPDHYIVFPEHVLLIECKLSQKQFAFPQMGLLYAPLLRHLYARPVVGVQACRNLRFRPDKYWVEEIEHEFDFRGQEDMLTWHAFGI